MRIIYKEDQDRALRYIIEIFEALVPHDDIESADAIIAAYRIAGIVGGDKMIKKLEVIDEDSSMDSSHTRRFEFCRPNSARKRAREILRRYKSLQQHPGRG